MEEGSLEKRLLEEKQRMISNGQIIPATFSYNLSGNNVALQVVIVCCPLRNKLSCSRK